MAEGYRFLPLLIDRPPVGIVRGQKGLTMSEYEIQAIDFLKKAETKMTISRTGEVEGFPFDEHDRLWHYRYQITLTRHGKQYRFTFFDSFYNWRQNKRPTRYDVLASVEKYEVPDNLIDFAADFGYNVDDPQDYKRVKKIHQACMKQYDRLFDLFGEDLMKELQEIN